MRDLASPNTADNRQYFTKITAITTMNAYNHQTTHTNTAIASNVEPQQPPTPVPWHAGWLARTTDMMKL